MMIARAGEGTSLELLTSRVVSVVFFLSVLLALEVRGYIEPEAGPVDPPMSTCQIYEDVCFEA